MLATRTPRVTGSAQGYDPPAINLSPPSPSIHPTYISCDASASEADDSFNLHTPTDSEFSHDGLEDRKFLEDCYPVLKARQSLDFSPSLDVIVEKPSPELDHHDFRKGSSRICVLRSSSASRCSTYTSIGNRRTLRRRGYDYNRRSHLKPRDATARTMLRSPVTLRR